MISVLIVLFISGLVLGSFYTVVGTRRPNNESIIKPRSHCTYCNHELKWYELIPLISFIIQGGKCRNCKKKLSFVYPLMELLTGILFALAFYLYGISYEFFAMLIISSLLVIIFVSDFKYMVILDGPLVICSILLLGLKYYYFGWKVLLISIVSGLVIFLFMMLIKFIGDRVFKQESLGGGDIKLATFFGFVLAIRLGFISLVVGCFVAFPYAIYSVFSNNNREIPFGPFLITGLLIVFLLATQITNFIDIIL